MAQNDLVIANQSFPSFRTDLNSALQAINTSQSGTSRPSGAVAGTIWLDTTSPTTPTLKYYDGADDISLATLDHSANTVNWLDSTVSITGLSTTATGTVLTLSDSASTSTVNLIIDNQKEIRFRETTANGTNYVALKAPASVSADLTFTLPSADGTNGQVLSTNGSGVLSFITPSAGISWQSSVETANFTADAGKGYFCNTTSAGFTVTLPATPTAGQQVAVVDYAGTFDTNVLTISPNGNKIEGSTSNFILNGEREGVLLVYIDSTQGWLAVSGINEGTDALAESFTADFLVIAGAGGGGDAGSGGLSYGAGGGGAGGYRTSAGTSGGGASAESALTLGKGVSYTVTVGAGGASNTTGSNSVFSSITSNGGGGQSGINGLTGGSGGGGTPNGGTGGSGTANQGFAGGNGGATLSSGGSGGGAGGLGNNGVLGIAGTTTGGLGVASSITGSSVTRAVGGAGGRSDADADGTAGGANTGTGGGGAGVNSGGSQTGGAGGSGIVIVKYPDTITISNTGGGLTFSTSTAGGFKVTSFTAGTGNIQFN
jgi:hypothetical protein